MAGSGRGFRDWSRAFSGRDALIVAVLSTLATGTLAWVSHEAFPRDGFLFFYMPVVGAVAYLWGPWPGGVAAAVSLVTARFFLISPPYTFRVSGQTFPILVLFALIAGLMVDGARRLRNAEMATYRLQEQDRMLNAIATAVGGQTDLQQILCVLLNHLRPAVDFTGGSIILREGDELILRAAEGPFSTKALGQRLPRGVGRVWEVIDRGEPFLSPDLLAEGLTPTTPVRSYLAVPLLRSGGPFGVLEIDSTEPRAFEAVDLMFMQRVASVLSGSVEIVLRYAAEAQAKDDAEVARQAEQGAREAAERATDRIERVREITAALAEALTPEQAAAVAVDQGVRALGAQAGALSLVASDGLLDLVWASGYPEDLTRRWQRCSADQHGPIGDALRMGRVIWYASSEDLHADYPEHEPLPASLADGGQVAVPVMVRDRAIGVLYLNFRERPAFETDDSEFLLTLGRLCAQAVERAREADRRRFEALEALNDVVSTLHSAVRIEQVMQVIADVAQRLSGGGQAFAGFFQGRGEPAPTEYRSWEVAGAPRTVFERLDHLHITPLFAPIFEGRGTVRSGDIHTHPLFRGLPEGHLPVRSYLAVPVVLQSGQVLGAILLGHAEPDRFDGETQQHVESLALHAALVLEKALLYEREHHIAATLQRTLLPRTLPQVSGVRIDAVYQAAGPEAEVGGDWYDAFALPGGRLVLTVGDVAGRGLDAAVLMGEMRHAIRTTALAGHDPAKALQVANSIVRADARRMVTAVVAILDPITLLCTYAAAGHPAPVLATPKGIEVLAQGTFPLGVRDGLPIEAESLRLPPEALLVFYTDGLIEFERDVVAGAAALQAAVAEQYTRRLDHPAHAILEQVLSGRPVRDDIAVLTAVIDLGSDLAAQSFVSA